MKITIILDAWQPLVGGGQKLFWKLASGLVGRGYQVTIIARALNYQGKKYVQDESFFDGKLKVVRIGPATSWPNLFGRLWFIFSAVPVALKTNPDIFMASSFLPGVSLQLIKLFSSRPKVLVAIGFGVSRFLIWLEKLITQVFKYDLLITDDQPFFNLMKDKRPIKYIVNGVDIPKGAPKFTQHQKGAGFTYLFVGRNESRKGLPVLRQAFIKVKKQFPEAQLKLIGPGLKKVSDEELNRTMLSADVLVLPSLREGHPLVLFEAWAHQLPVIATNVGSVARFVNADNGYLVPSGDVQALAQAMIQAQENKNLSAMGEAGYEMVKSGYTWEKTVDRYDQALKVLTMDVQNGTL